MVVGCNRWDHAAGLRAWSSLEQPRKKCPGCTQLKHASCGALIGCMGAAALATGEVPESDAKGWEFRCPGLVGYTLCGTACAGVTSTSQGQKFQKFEEYRKSVRIKMADLAGR